MHIIFNGIAVELPPGSTLVQCLNAQQCDPKSVVVECNGRIVPAQDFAQTVLNPGDVLEVLHFVGGG